MRVVVAGSHGLIGTALLAALRENGHEVQRLVRRGAHASDEISWEPVTGRIDAAQLAGVDAVVNLGGVGIGDRRWSGARKQEIRDSRIDSTEVLARAVATAGVPTLLNANAVGFYGDSGDRVVDESKPAGTGFLARVCTDWQQATAAASTAGARVAVLRIGVVLSSEGGMLDRLGTLYRLGLGGRLGDGRQYMSWISLEDAVRALVFLLEHPEISGPVNLTGPAPVTNIQFSAALARTVRRPAPWAIPSFALKAVLGEFASEGVLSGQRAIPTVLEENGFEFRHHTVGEALDAVLG